MILRFLGTTPDTSNISETFKSIVYQLSRIFETVKPIESSRKLNSRDEIKEYLLEQLWNISFGFPEKKVIILLDSIDQLNPTDFEMDWIMTNLPENVKIILSTLPEHGGILEMLISIITTDSNFMEVKCLTKSAAIEIISDWLKKYKRSLSDEQWTILNDLFNISTLFPLYVKLIFDIIVKWTSYYVPDNEFKSCTEIDNCIRYMFKSLEKIHGKVLFSRCMFYMSTFKNGIAENELEDILTIDDEVLYEIFEYHIPPVRIFIRFLICVLNKSYYK